MNFKHYLLYVLVAYYLQVKKIIFSMMLNGFDRTRRRNGSVYIVCVYNNDTKRTNAAGGFACNKPLNEISVGKTVALTIFKIQSFGTMSCF